MSNTLKKLSTDLIEAAEDYKWFLNEHNFEDEANEIGQFQDEIKDITKKVKENIE